MTTELPVSNWVSKSAEWKEWYLWWWCSSYWSPWRRLSNPASSMIGYSGSDSISYWPAYSTIVSFETIWSIYSSIAGDRFSIDSIFSIPLFEPWGIWSLVLERRPVGNERPRKCTADRGTWCNSESVECLDWWCRRSTSSPIQSIPTTTSIDYLCIYDQSCSPTRATIIYFYLFIAIYYYVSLFINIFYHLLLFMFV